MLWNVYCATLVSGMCCIMMPDLMTFNYCIYIPFLLVYIYYLQFLLLELTYVVLTSIT